MESDGDLLLKLATHWKQRKPYNVPALGDILDSYVRQNVKPAKKGSPVVEAWNKVVPAVMNEFCRVESFQGGILKVSVSEPTYRFQMEMLKKELIESIETEVGGKVKIRDIRFV